MKISPLTLSRMLFLCFFLFYFHLSYSNQSLIQPGAILILMGMEGEWMGMVSKGPETTKNNMEKWHFNKVVSPSLGSPLWWETLLIHTNLFFFFLSLSFNLIVSGLTCSIQDCLLQHTDSSCGVQAQKLQHEGSRVRPKYLSCVGRVAPWYVGS